jgi:hypothetical protein
MIILSLEFNSIDKTLLLEIILCLTQPYKTGLSDEDCLLLIKTHSCYFTTDVKLLNTSSRLALLGLMRGYKWWVVESIGSDTILEFGLCLTQPNKTGLIGEGCYTCHISRQCETKSTP